MQLKPTVHFYPFSINLMLRESTLIYKLAVISVYFLAEMSGSEDFETATFVFLKFWQIDQICFSVCHSASFKDLLSRIAFILLKNLKRVLNFTFFPVDGIRRY